MKQPVNVLRKWIKIISDDYMHWDSEYIDNVILPMAKTCFFEILPDDKGVIGYIPFMDWDKKKKLAMQLLYLKPEHRCMTNFCEMIQLIDSTAKEFNCDEIQIGYSVSGYKEEKFNKLFSRYGYKQKSTWVK